MSNNWEQFLEKYTKASADTQALLDSDAIANFVEKIIQDNSLETTLRTGLIKIVSGHLVGMFRDTLQTEVEALVTDESKVLAIRNAIAGFTREHDTGKKTERLQLRPDSVESAVTDEIRPVTKEELISSIATSRTMAQDVARATGKPAPAPAVQEGEKLAVPEHAPVIKKELPAPPAVPQPPAAPSTSAEPQPPTPPSAADEPLPYTKPMTETPSYSETNGNPQA